MGANTHADDAPSIDDLSAAVIDGCTKHYGFHNHDNPTEWAVAFRRTEEERQRERFEPMINTLWPLPDRFDVPDDVRDRLDNMTVVEVSEDDGLNHYLALTGGGMDMSWSIARTYVFLGYLPPSTLGKLPGMGGMDYDAPENRRARLALRKSHSLMRDRLAGYIRDLDALDD